MSRLFDEAGLPPLSPRARLRFDVLSRIIDELHPVSVLEIGCGQGAVGARLANRAQYLGAEPDPQSWAVARDRIEPLGGHVRLGTDAVVEAGRTFAMVCAFEVLEHIDDDFGAVRAWADRVQPGGHLLISVPADQERFGPMDELVGHYRRYDESGLAACVAAAGLEEISMTRYGWPLTYLLEGVRNGLDARRLAKARGHEPEELSAASGRTFQPSARVTGRGVELITVPFRGLQRLRPSRGTGLVILASKA